MFYRRRFLVASAAAFALPAHAQAPWPSKPIKLVVPYAPGGSTDVVGRVIAEYLGQRLGQNIVVENRPGKGASIGTSQVAKAQPDGYTLLVSNISSFAIAPPLYGDLDYDPVNDFTHITLASFNPSVLVVNPSFSAKTLAEYVAYAKANPDKLAFATSGPGSSNHILGTMLGLVGNIKLVHIPYRGAGPAMQDTIAGNVPSMFDSLPSAAPHIKTGKVRALAVSGAERNPSFPDVPTLKEQGYPTLVSYSWFGLSGPAKLPAPMVERLAAEMQVVLKNPDVIKRWQDIGAESSTMTPAEYTAFVKTELEKATAAVKASGAKPD
ncbi:MAG: tripartite tricarboxylate transporter substrate binding protein [Enhydrobacter sp.]|nr:tripartite tricarboxylate transporter substrate binding protein [Enhydrobacter sp.]